MISEGEAVKHLKKGACTVQSVRYTNGVFMGAHLLVDVKAKK